MGLPLSAGTCWLGCLAVLVTGAAARAQTDEPATSLVAKQPSFFTVSDTQVSYWHEFTGAEPGIAFPVSKNVVSLTHFDEWRYGTNFVNIDFLLSDNRDPQYPWGGPGFPLPADGSGIGSGALEVFGTYRGTLSFNRLSGTETFRVGPLRDLSLYVGGDANTKNTAFDPRQRDIVAGLQLAFDVPGYLNVAAAFYKEWNHNGIVPLLGNPPGMSEYVSFAATATFEAQYMQPLDVTGVPLRLSGWANLILPKGTDGFGIATLAEFETDHRLTLDIGKLVADRPNLFDAFVGYRFWLNKFGTTPYPANSPPLPGTLESTFYLGVAWHVF